MITSLSFTTGLGKVENILEVLGAAALTPRALCAPSPEPTSPPGYHPCALKRNTCLNQSAIDKSAVPHLASRYAGISIMQIGGWKTRSAFIRYAIVAEDHIANAMQALEQRNGALVGND